MFNPESIYLPTKKIGKNNPKEAEIRADNEARQEWNRTADMALITGISEAKTMEVKQEQIHDEVKKSIEKNGFMPNLFRTIVGKAKEFLQSLIRQQDMPKRPTLSIDMAEFRAMQKLMIKVQDKAKSIKHLQEKVLPELEKALSETTGLFKGKERKALTEKIQKTKAEISKGLDEMPDVLKDEGYPDVMAFMKTYREMENVVARYEREVWEYEQKLKQKEQPAERPPERKSIRAQLRQLQAEGKQQARNRKSFDRER